MVQDESGGAAGGGGRCEQKLTSGLPKPITAPCGSLIQCTRWRSRAATWVSLMTPERDAAEV